MNRSRHGHHCGKCILASHAEQAHVHGEFSDLALTVPTQSDPWHKTRKILSRVSYRSISVLKEELILMNFLPKVSSLSN